MDPRYAACLVLFAVVPLSGCKSPGSVAKEHFARTFSCPADRVEVRARPELHFRRHGEWHDEIYEVRGCNYQTLYTCDRPDKQTSSITCSPNSYPTGVSRW